MSAEIMKPPTTDDDNGEGNEIIRISEEVSKKVCSHMNEDHSSTVYAMARKLLLGSLQLEPGYYISDARMKKVSLDSCTIQAVTCRQDMCQVHNLSWPFEPPPLKTRAELRSRLVAIHHQVCAPRLAWLIEKPAAVVFITLMTFLNYCMIILGKKNLRLAIERDTTLNSIVSLLFGSPKMFCLLVQASFYFGHSAHAAEAAYAAYHCLRTLKLSWLSTFQWVVMVFVTGYPVLSELLPVANAALRKKKSS